MAAVTSAAVLLAAAAALCLVMASQLSTGTAAPAPPPPPPMRLDNCSTTCGDVVVPYPFGFGPASCYWPGLNLTCDTSHDPPRLVLGDGTLRVTEISLKNKTVRVVGNGTIMKGSDIISDGILTFGRSFPDDYILSTSNELVVAGCNVMATLGYLRDPSYTSVTSGCASICASNGIHESTLRQPSGKYCSGMGCCQAPIVRGTYLDRDVQIRWLHGQHRYKQDMKRLLQPFVFVAESGWFDQRSVADEMMGFSGRPKSPEASFEVPVLLRWAVMHGVDDPVAVYPSNRLSACSPSFAGRLCKSKHSQCKYKYDGRSNYWCQCRGGYDGNPYIDGGCQDINECEHPQDYGCFGECTNIDGGFQCRCPRGSHGNHTLPGGCVLPDQQLQRKGLSIGIGVGSGAGLILLVFIAIFMIQRFKYRRAIKLKQKFFIQNRGQLLQQLVSQRADIAERMIIPVDELAKATNNFDKARELGGGGHGTVYKGILSDLHVVAIKKSKITIQNEIDEFINEVAILSQINHRNVVKLLGCCLETEVPLLVYEFISNGTLYHHLHVEGLRSLSWSDRLRIAAETSSSLAYLHSSVSVPVIHRDIKSTNILLDDTLTSKVSDFGASRFIPIDKTGLTTKVQGTIGYLDPMYLYTGRLTEKSDVYSFGVILVELLTRKKPFSYFSSKDDGLVVHFATLLAEDNLVQILDPQVIEEGGKEIGEVAVLAASCIKLNAEDRPTMRQVEHTLQRIRASKKHGKDNMVAEDVLKNDSIVMNYPSTEEGQSMNESSRGYSLEEDPLVFARHPR